MVLAIRMKPFAAYTCVASAAHSTNVNKPEKNDFLILPPLLPNFDDFVFAL
jgi:hypothetical protein